MSIYSLKQGYYLYHDIEFVLNQVEELYTVEVKEGKLKVFTKIPLDKKYHFASKESAETFNKLIPKIKTLHTGMYHLLESIYRASGNNVFDTNTIEQQFPDFKYFRLLNNKIKHFNDADIDLIQVVLMDGTINVIEIGCRFKTDNGWEMKYYANFITLVLNILEGLELITFDEG